MGGLLICIYTVVLFTCANYIIIIYTIFIVKLYSRLPVRTGRPSVCSFSLISTSLVFIVIHYKTITKNYCNHHCLLNVLDFQVVSCIIIIIALFFSVMCCVFYCVLDFQVGLMYHNKYCLIFKNCLLYLYFVCQCPGGSLCHVLYFTLITFNTNKVIIINTKGFISI